jgi:hypothetical protein
MKPSARLCARCFRAKRQGDRSLAGTQIALSPLVGREIVGPQAAAKARPRKPGWSHVAARLPRIGSGACSRWSLASHVLPAKCHFIRVDPTRLELVASAMRRLRSSFLCILTSRKFPISKPNLRCSGESLFCCFHLSSNWVAARLLHTRRVLFGLFAILPVVIVGLATWAAVRYRRRVLGSLPLFGALSSEPLRLP